MTVHDVAAGAAPATTGIGSFADVPLRGERTTRARHRRLRDRQRRSRRCGTRVHTRAVDVVDAGKHRRQAGVHRRRPGRGRRLRLSVGLVPRRAPVPARAVSDDVRQPAVDDPAVRRVLHGSRIQCVLSPEPRRRAEGAVGRVRPRDSPRVRLRPSPRRGRRRNGRCGNRFHPGHAAAVRWYRSVDGVCLDDDERRGAAGTRAVCGCRRGTGCAAGEARGDDPERHPQRVHGPQHLHLSAQAVDADHLRHLRLHEHQNAEVQLDLDLRLSHPRGRCDSGFGVGLHAGRWCGVHQGGSGRGVVHRQVRPAALVLLGHRDELLHGGRQAARRPAAVERAGRRVRSAEREIAFAAHAFADVGLVADGAGPVQQRRPHVHRGDGGHPGAHAVAAHQRPRRGARAAHRLLREDRAQHAASAAAGVGHHTADRPVGRLVLRGVAHPPARREGSRPHRRGERARRHGCGH